MSPLFLAQPGPHPNPTYHNQPPSKHPSSHASPRSKLSQLPRLYLPSLIRHSRSSLSLGSTRLPFCLLPPQGPQVPSCHLPNHKLNPPLCAAQPVPVQSSMQGETRVSTVWKGLSHKDPESPPPGAPRRHPKRKPQPIATYGHISRHH